MNIDWNLINIISQIDRFDSNWGAIEKKESVSLNLLRSAALAQSIGASTRLEGQRMTHAEANVFFMKHEANRRKERIPNEIADYLETLEAILDSYAGINFNETTVSNIHSALMRYKKKDSWFKNFYKLHSSSDAVQNVTKQIMSHSPNSGFSLTDAITNLINWYNSEKEIHPLIKTAIFMYDFLGAYPFENGNKRISRIIPQLLLLKNGYKWVQYISFEGEIEKWKDEYYRILRDCQENSPNENITEWILFFLDLLICLQKKIIANLKKSGIETRLSPREKAIIALISSNPGTKSGEIASKLDIPNPTTKRILAYLLQNGLIERYGNGRSTNYSID
jgi:Fic family protein